MDAPVLAQIVLILQSGGIGNYINNIGKRVILWRGKGYILETIKLYGVLNLFYFTILIKNIQKKLIY